jgi:predicted enzyme related to lactoylglutathione lyase
MVSAGGANAAADGGGENPGAAAGSDAGPAPAGSPAPPPAVGAIHCRPREVSGGDATLHIHHIHFNTQDPDAGIAFAQRYFNAQPVDFCSDEASPRVTRAAKTERAWFLYTKTSTPPSSMRLNRLAHVGYNHPDVQAELDRLLALDVPLADTTACATAAQGTPCNTFNVLWFYVETPESARFEVATGPGPSTRGFSHIHLIAPTFAFFQDVLGSSLKDSGGTRHIDGVNMIDAGRTGVIDETINYQDTRGAAIDHIGFSTTELEGTQARIEEAGVKIEEPISFKPEHGFRSFMVRSPEGVWLEILEDAPFAP